MIILIPWKINYCECITYFSSTSPSWSTSSVESNVSEKSPAKKRTKMEPHTEFNWWIILFIIQNLNLQCFVFFLNIFVQYLITFLQNIFWGGSLNGINEQYVREKNLLKYILTNTLFQDHPERFLSAIRSKGW